MRALRQLLSEHQLRQIDRLVVRARFVWSFGARYYGMSIFKWIDGFLLDEEAVRLYELARGIHGGNIKVVEIGSWLGKSSVVLGSALAAKRGGTLVCIDPFDASGDERSRKRYQADANKLNNPLRMQFESNLKRARVSPIVSVQQGLSHEVVKSWRDPIDMLFIDGNHAFDAVRQDFLDWSPFVRPGGMLAFHDTYFGPPANSSGEYHAGPGRVIQEYVLPSANWQTVCHVGSLFVSRRANSG
jgi:predicted O-methyltransferase YrrM